MCCTFESYALDVYDQLFILTISFCEEETNARKSLTVHLDYSRLFWYIHEMLMNIL